MENNTTVRLTAHQIIDETVEFYSKNARSFDLSGRSCLYNGAKGEKCAFSRCCKNSIVSSLKEGAGCASFTNNSSLDHLLQPQYHGQSVRFWQDIQALHDGNWFWLNNCLIPEGINKVQELKLKYVDQ
jgi:hypothetical protein